MATRRDWLDTGLEILAERGARALTVDQLTMRVGLSKGSFYHHFGGIPNYVSALMAHFETEHTARYIQRVESEPGLTAGEKLARLVELAVAQDRGPALEVAVRSWARENPEVAATQTRVDTARIDYLRRLCHEIAGAADDADDADDLGLLLYLLVVGAESVHPPVPLARVARLYDRVLHPEHAGAAPPRPPLP